MKKRLLILPAVGVLGAAEIYRRGFAAPLLYGARLWLRALRTLDPRYEEDDVIV